ncbi:MAG: hypothetical protein KY428_05135, partial [Bacteroidetes bacterium]|nr:hypothetical protein [Bacteroidota bacterium]
MYLRTKPYHLQNLNLAENKFDYIWEYRYEDDPIDIDCSVTTPTSTCYAGTNLSLCKDGTSQYDPSCQQCNCTEEEIWQPAQLTGSPTSTETINFPAFRRSSSNRIKFRYRLKHKLYGQLGPPSAATSYITVFKAPPVVNHNEDPNPILNSATATVYNQATDDIKIEHVECKGDSTGRFTIKHVVGDGKYYYNIRGPLPAGSKWPHNENGSSAQTYNLNGENLPAPNQNNSTTWLTFPDVLTDPAKPAGFFAGRYVLVVENLDERSSTGTTDGFGDILERKCFDTVYFTIKEPLAAVTYSIADTSNYNGYGVSCRTAADGWVQLGAAGGIGPYTYYLKANTPGAILLDNVDGYFSGLAALDATGNPITYQYY